MKLYVIVRQSKLEYNSDVVGKTAYVSKELAERTKTYIEENMNDPFSEPKYEVMELDVPDIERTR